MKGHRATISEVMDLILLGMHILSAVFLIGLAGSSIVVIISFVEDLHELFGED